MRATLASLAARTRASERITIEESDRDRLSALGYVGPTSAAPGELTIVPGCNHFTVVGELQDKDSPMVAAIAGLAASVFLVDNIGYDITIAWIGMMMLTGAVIIVLVQIVTTAQGKSNTSKSGN